MLNKLEYVNYFCHIVNITLYDYIYIDKEVKIQQSIYYSECNIIF